MPERTLPMAQRYWPLGAGRVVTSPFGPRAGGFHYGADFGRAGGSANMPVYAVADGTVIHAGAAQGYGGPDPAGWLVIDHPAAAGGGCSEYGHIIREVARGDRVRAGQRIGRINPDSRTNGGTAPHLHLSVMPGGYNPATKIDPIPWLGAALEPDVSLTPKPDQSTEAPVSNRPAYNEFPIWSKNNSVRRLGRPDCFFIHTQEGGGGNAAAENLARWFQSGNNVSYHYTISQASDGGVTVVDCVDTDRAAWAVLDANTRSINLCFAGSRAAWTRDDWLKQANAIDVAAYLAVQDAKKYNFPTLVVEPPYGERIPGISDHRYVTNIMKIGTHHDVGDGFPWDVFDAAVRKYATGQTPPPAKPPVPQPIIVGPADHQLTMRFNCLGGQTLVEAVAELRDAIKGTSDRHKPGVVVK